MRKTIVILNVPADAVLHSVRNASLGRKMSYSQACIPLGMQPAIKGRIPNGMRVSRVDIFSTERYSLTGIENTIQ
jgi:hypothetical protein